MTLERHLPESATAEVSAELDELELLAERLWMKTNALRSVLGKQGTGVLLLASSRNARLCNHRLLSAALSDHRKQPGPLSIKHFSSTRSLRDRSYQTTTFEDPSRKGLFYHLVPPPTPLSDTRPVFAVSLLADPPPFSESSTVLGWLPAETPGEDHEAGLNDFVQNRAYAVSIFRTRLTRRSFMPSSLLASPSRGDIERTRGGRRRYPGFGCAATRRGLDAYTWYASALLPRAERITNFVSCNQDDRNLPPLNRIGDPDDILASVRVQGGKVRLSSIILVSLCLARSSISPTA
jgi:hypothetical protein